ncbi:tRNase Z TRZ3, mitochondrial [Silene latifolia]|uniref:tRNase Z TRZ3, mitochondrial n=1 Tax=Silene latifolia TaxID=37657 RepID=UPI003D76F538
MSQITSLRLLINNSPPKFTPFFSKPIKHFYLSTVFSSLSKPNRKNLHSAAAKPFINTKNNRGNSSLADKINTEKGSEMEQSGFNKRRAEGKDKSDKPKNLQLKTRKLNPVNTISYVQILGTGMDTQDTCPSVLLFFDKQRFIFNAGEGLQRYCTEHKIKLSKIDHIFLSRVCSETAGGLPGLLLTMAGIGDEGMCVNMWGPSDLNYLVNAMRAFIPSAAMVHTKSFGPTLQLDGLAALDSKKFSGPFDLIDDEVVKISAILLNPKENIGPASDTGNGELGPPLKPGDISVIYVCELPKIQGRFHPEKAKALGLRAGPKYRDLQNNISVKSDDRDIMVHPRDVMDPPIPGPIVLLVDCPTTLHLQSLLSADSLNVYYTDFSGSMSETAKAVNCVIHLSPSSVSNSPDYQKWMKRFGQVQHIMAGHEEKNVEIPVLKSSARIAARLNYLCPQFFPASGFWPPQIENNSLHSKSSNEEPQATISAENLLKFNLRPHANLGLDRSSVPLATGPAEIVDELRVEIPEIVEAVQQVRQLWDHPGEAQNDVSSQDMMEEPWLDELGLPSCLENVTREDMEIVLLGTGSSQPSKYRNVTSIFINLFSKGSLLFDCGEGTLGQLKRRFGVEGADDAVRNLRCIWISHIHADHHTGLARILALRRDLLKDVPHEPLLVVGPGQLMRFLNAYQRLEELDMQFLDCKFTTRASWDSFEKSNSISDEPSSSNSKSPVDSTLFTKGTPMQSYWQKPGSPVGNAVIFKMLSSLKNILQEASLEILISFPVVHCPQAYGVSLKAAQRSNKTGEMIPGWKIVYSGDTRPCPQLIEESRGATVLIHEATFEDGLADEAVARNHSTTQEAIDVGEAAGVYRIILTHFSQRYPKIPVFGDAHMHNTCIGFDMMSINLADLPVLPQVLPHLKLLFRNEMGVDEIEDLPLEEVTAAT